MVTLGPAPVEGKRPARQSLQAIVHSRWRSPFQVRARSDAANSGSNGSARDFQPEIQGLRAVAVALVVLFHLWPAQISGGYVGVDVFFVISGYLITAHLFREVSRTGRLSLPRFWARRIRRLLPAALLVLAVSAVATVLFLPPTVWANTARQLGASAVYVQNWVLASDAVDYLAQHNAPTLAQHYWSLSVEEQFYVVWPLLVVAVLFLARRIRLPLLRSPRRWLAAALAGVAVASLVWSIVMTASDQARAYFVTPTRVWEFAAGGLLALLMLSSVRRAVMHWVFGAAGIAAIVAAGLLYDGASLFPGWIALLPVLGTVAVIWAGSSTGRFTPGWWLSRRPLTFVGDISYSVYLWHWPLVVVVPQVTGHALRPLDKVAILVATLALAWLSTRWIENPLRALPSLTKRPMRSFAFAAVGMAVVTLAGAAIDREVDNRASDAAAAADEVLEELAADAAPAELEVAGSRDASGENDERADSSTSCLGPRALERPVACAPVVGDGRLLPPPEVAAGQNAQDEYPGCQQTITLSEVFTCTLGSSSDDPDRVVAIVGDSHTTHWFPTLDILGKQRNWKIVTYAKSSCPATLARRLLPNEQTDDGARSCDEWVDDVKDRIADDDDISVVITSAYASAYEFEARSDSELDDPAVDGFTEVWSDWTNEDKDVFVIRDVPPTPGDIPNCLVSYLDDRMACATDAGDLPDDAIAIAATRSDDPRVHLIDLTEQFCDDDTCYPVVGDIIVYKDESHLTREYAIALSSYLGTALDGTLPAAR